MSPIFKELKKEQILQFAVFFAIIIGILLSFIFLYQDDESYSGLYLNPNSIIFNAQDKTVSFTYGVSCWETSKKNYNLDIFSNDIWIINKQFTLNKGEKWEERVHISIPQETTYPNKIILKLDTGTGIEQVFFWIS